MKGLKNKRGISLIVLVITIIVMIILAASIILTLNSSNAIGKANQAVSDTDLANLKSAATTYSSEYKLEVEIGGLDPEKISAQDYIMDKLYEHGFSEELLDLVSIDSEGNVAVLREDSVQKIVANNNVQKGAKVVGYTLTEKTYKTDGSEHPNEEDHSNGAQQTLKTDIDMTWRYVGLDKDGKVLIAPDMPAATPSTSKIEITNYEGYDLSEICNALYTTDKGKAKSFNMQIVSDILDTEIVQGEYNEPDWDSYECTEGEYAGTATKTTIPYSSSNKNNSIIYFAESYWLEDSAEFGASFSCYEHSDEWIWGTDDEWYDMFIVSSSGVDSVYMNAYQDYEAGGDTLAIRPIVTLNSNVNALYNPSTNTITLK